ncbi:MAG: hypothetical protein WBP72_17040, partial [Rhodocyclaceae bacterium]
MTARILRLALAVELLVYVLSLAFLGSVFDWGAGTIALSAIGLVLCVRLWVIANTFAFAWRYRSPRTPGQTMEVLAAVWMFLREYASLLALFLAIQPFERWFMGEDRMPGGEGAETPPVLLVHGYGCNRGSWWWLRPRLERAGLRVATVNLEPLYGSIDDY